MSRELVNPPRQHPRERRGTGPSFKLIPSNLTTHSTDYRSCNKSLGTLKPYPTYHSPNTSSRKCSTKTAALDVYRNAGDDGAPITLLSRSHASHGVEHNTAGVCAVCGCSHGATDAPYPNHGFRGA